MKPGIEGMLKTNFHFKFIHAPFYFLNPFQILPFFPFGYFLNPFVIHSFVSSFTPFLSLISSR